MKRSSSDPFLNVDFGDNYSFWIYYVFVILIVRYVFFLLEQVYPLWPAWTLVNILHALITFYLMHYQGAQDDGTFWDLLDSGDYNTPAKKFFTLVPIGMYVKHCVTHYVLCASGLFLLLMMNPICYRLKSMITWNNGN